MKKLNVLMLIVVSIVILIVILLGVFISIRFIGKDCCNDFNGMGPGMMWNNNYKNSEKLNNNNVDSAENVFQQNEKAVDENIREIKITAKRFEYSPNEIILKKGERVKLVIENLDFVHGLHFEGLPGEPGDDYEYIFEAIEVGEFIFHCNNFCGAGHEEMMGKVIVIN